MSTRPPASGQIRIVHHALERSAVRPAASRCGCRWQRPGQVVRIGGEGALAFAVATRPTGSSSAAGAVGSDATFAPVDQPVQRRARHSARGGRDVGACANDHPRQQRQPEPRLGPGRSPAAGLRRDRRPGRAPSAAGPEVQTPVDQLVGGFRLQAPACPRTGAGQPDSGPQCLLLLLLPPPPSPPPSSRAVSTWL